MPRGKPFQKGKDPRRNEGGQPPEVREVKAALREAGIDIAEVLKKKAKRGNLYAVVKALEWIIGKPKQELELTGKDGGPIRVRADLSRLNAAQLEQLEQLLALAAPDAGGSPGGAPPAKPD